MKSYRLRKDFSVDVCDEEVDLKTFIQTKVNTSGREDKDDPFFVCDLGDIIKKWRRFQQILPRVQPFYAVKCNPDVHVLQLLAQLGANFDCASKNEIKLILEAGVSPERIIFANPCKQNSFIKYAASTKVNLMTFDNATELHKIKQHHPNAELLIRIKVDDSMALCSLSSKFGVSVDDSYQLLETAKKLDLNVVGVSFHIGSGSYSASPFYDAVELAHNVFQQGDEIGFKFKLLDVGGGFPGVDGEAISFEEAAEYLNLGLKKFFPEESSIRIIAEPGRYFVASAYTSVCNVTSIRHVDRDNGASTGFMYYLNDGVYGSFNCILYDHQAPKAKALHEDKDVDVYNCSLWGPTCDSLDRIAQESWLPQLDVGEWIYFENMGAYTIAAGSKFNGFKRPIVMYMCREQFADLIIKEVDKNITVNKPISKCMHACAMNPMEVIAF